MRSQQRPPTASRHAACQSCVLCVRAAQRVLVECIGQPTYPTQLAYMPLAASTAHSPSLPLLHVRLHRPCSNGASMRMPCMIHHHPPPLPLPSFAAALHPFGQKCTHRLRHSRPLAVARATLTDPHHRCLYSPQSPAPAQPHPRQQDAPSPHAAAPALPPAAAAAAAPRSHAAASPPGTAPPSAS